MDRVDPYLIPALDGVAYGLLLFVVAAGLVLSFGVTASPSPAR
jgi:branched-chain amino acid transport system permease protein